MKTAEIKPGAITICQIAHEEWCNTLKTGKGGDCNCDPVVRMIPIKSDADLQKYLEGQL